MEKNQKKNNKTPTTPVRTAPAVAPVTAPSATKKKKKRYYAPRNKAKSELSIDSPKPVRQPAEAVIVWQPEEEQGVFKKFVQKLVSFFK